jgi:restriction endonuclease S subunit
LDNINTPLYDPHSKHNDSKINHLIDKNFKGKNIEIPLELEQYVIKSSLIHLIDFTRPDFNKGIATSPKRVIEVETIWESRKIGDIDNLIVKKGSSITKKDVEDGDIPVVAGGMSLAYYHNKSNRNKNSITISASGANAGFVNFWKEAIFASDCTTINSTNDDFIYYVFNILKGIQSDIFSLARGAAQPHVYPDDIKEIKIPLPPPEVQKEIVKACEAIDKEAEQAEKIIKMEQDKIDKVYSEIYNSDLPLKPIEEISLNVQYGINDSMNTHNKGYKIFRMNEIVQGYMNDNGSMKYVNITKEEFEKYKLSKGDILFNRTNSIEHVGKTGLFNLDGEYCYASYLVRIEVDPEKAIPEYVNYLMNSDQFQTYAKSQATKSINQANINATKMKAIEIPIPDKKLDQKKYVNRILACETKIKASQKLITEITNRKEELIRSYLMKKTLESGLSLAAEPKMKYKKKKGKKLK